jgi:hypothetical protein
MKGVSHEQQLPLEAIPLTPIFNTTAITPKPWSAASSSFPNQNEKTSGLEIETELLCEEAHGNKSTSPDYITIYHHAFCFPGGIIGTYPICRMQSRHIFSSLNRIKLEKITAYWIEAS